MCRSPWLEQDGGAWRESLVEVGDRVVVVGRGGAGAARERGKVGRVTEVRRNEGEVVVEDLNLVCSLFLCLLSLHVSLGFLSENLGCCCCQYSLWRKRHERQPMQLFIQCTRTSFPSITSYMLTLHIQAEVKVPSYIMVADPSSPPIRTISLPIPLSQIRLVYPMTRYDSSGNAQTVDTIVEKLIRLPNHGRKRFIANSHRATGSWVEVPIQKKYQPEKEKPKDHDIDTLRFEVETSTWTPTLLRAPMPGGVIDELRNKYSKFRTRHDPGYQRAIDNRAARKAAWEEAKKNGGVSGFLSPAKEARAREVEELRKRGKPELETEVLEMIGEVMARKGVVMTEGRRREVERNLRGEVWGGSALAKKDGVEGEQEEMSANQEASLGKAGEELQNAMEKMGIDEVITSEGKDPRSDRHP